MTRPTDHTSLQDEPLLGVVSAARLARALRARSSAPWHPARSATLVTEAGRVVDALEGAASLVPRAVRRRSPHDRRFAEALFEARLCLEPVLATLPDPGTMADHLLALDTHLAAVGAAALTELVEGPARAALRELAPPIAGRPWSVFGVDAEEPAR